MKLHVDADCPNRPPSCKVRFTSNTPTAREYRDQHQNVFPGPPHCMFADVDIEWQDHCKKIQNAESQEESAMWPFLAEFLPSFLSTYLPPVRYQLRHQLSYHQLSSHNHVNHSLLMQLIRQCQMPNPVAHYFRRMQRQRRKHRRKYRRMHVRMHRSCCIRLAPEHTNP